jgi:hypothetical protein
MFRKLKKKLAKLKSGSVLSSEPVQAFHSFSYLRHNARRLEHLATLKIPVRGKTVLEVGAGIGDHSTYYIDRGCDITITEARPENVAVMKERFPGAKISILDMEKPAPVTGAPFEVVHCYGLLYHLGNPEVAIEYLAKNTSGVLLLETCVSFGNESQVNLVDEAQGRATQAVSGTGCRPTRPWIVNELKKHFPHVYMTVTQPNHEQFAIDWTAPDKHPVKLVRAVFVASRHALDSDQLTTSIPDHQTYCA